MVEPDLLDTLLNAQQPEVRAAAVRVVSHWHDRLRDPLALLAHLASIDEHPRVRLEAVRALAEIPSIRSVEVALRALDKPMDQFLDYAALADRPAVEIPMAAGGPGGPHRPGRRHAPGLRPEGRRLARAGRAPAGDA